MAAITWTDVTNHASGLSAFPAAARADLLAYVNALLDVSMLDGEDGPQTKLARIYLVAHVATVLGPTASGAGDAGPVSSESAGGLSRSYAVAAVAADESSYPLTHFGRLFRDVVNHSAARAGLVL